MKLKLKSLNYFLIVAALLAVSCEKDDSPSEKEENIKEKGFTFNEESIMTKIPESLKNSEDEYAKKCIGYIETAMDMSAFIDQLTPPEDATLVEMKSTESSGTYTWQHDGYGVYWTYSKEGDKSIWSVDIEVDGKKYDYIDAWQMNEGIKGEVKFNYNFLCNFGEQSKCDVLLSNYTWDFSNEGSNTFVYTHQSDVKDFEFAFKSEIVINKDGSGKIDYVTNDYVLYNMEWDAEGNGSWILMDGLNSGSWTI